MYGYYLRAKYAKIPQFITSQAKNIAAATVIGVPLLGYDKAEDMALTKVRKYKQHRKDQRTLKEYDKVRKKFGSTEYSVSDEILWHPLG